MLKVMEAKRYDW